MADKSIKIDEKSYMFLKKSALKRGMSLKSFLKEILTKCKAYIKSL